MKDELEADRQPTRIVAEEISSLHSRFPAATQPTGSSGRSVVQVPTREAANAIGVKRDVEDTCQHACVLTHDVAL